MRASIVSVQVQILDPQYWNASSNEQEWTQVRARRQCRHANRPVMRRKSEWICNRCAATCLMSCQSCLKCCAEREGRQRGSRSGARHDDRQGSTSGAGEGKRNSGPESSTTEEARTALQSATSAGLPQGVITSLEQEACCAERRSPPGRSPDQCDKHLMLEDHVKANQQEKPAAQATQLELTSIAKIELATTLRQLWNKSSSSSKHHGRRDKQHREWTRRCIKLGQSWTDPGQRSTVKRRELRTSTK